MIIMAGAVFFLFFIMFWPNKYDGDGYGGH